MAANEEERAKWMLRPCTAAGTNRKPAAKSSYKEGDPPPEGWIDVYALAEPPSFDPAFESQRREAAIDKFLQDAKLPAAPAPVVVKPDVPVAAKPATPAAVKQSPPAPGGGIKLTRRLTKGEIRSIIALKPEPFPSADDYLDDLAQFEPPEIIAEKRRQHEADVAYFGDRDEKYEAFRQKVIKGLKEDGYYEVDSDYIAARDKANQRAIRAPRIPFSWMEDPSDLKGRVATPEDHQRWLREGCQRRYVPDAEDALLISYGEEDDDSMTGSDEEDGDSVSDEDEDAEEAQGHRGAPVEDN